MKERLINIIEAFMLQDCGSESLRKDAVRTLNAASASPLLLDRIPTDGIDKIKHLLHLHACEQEGLSSGQPTPQDWIKAVDEANEAIDRLDSATSKGESSKCIVCGISTAENGKYCYIHEQSK